MNNKQGQMGQVGMVILLAITLIVGAILLVAAAQNTGQVTDTSTLANKSFTLGAEGASVYLTDYKAISSPVIYNATGTLVPAANYTVTNNVVYNGQEAIKITTGAVNVYANDSANISGVAQPLTYSSDAGARSMTNLIIILMALALMAVAVGYAVKGYNDK